MNVSLDRVNAWMASPMRRVGFFLLAALMMARGVAQAQCGSNPDFIVLPDGSGTPEIVFVINTTVQGSGADSGGIGNIIMGTPDGTISQTQTLRITTTGHVFPNNQDPCSPDANTAGVTVEKTGVVNMQGGSLEPIFLNIAGPATGDSALGGVLSGYGTVKSAGGPVSAFDLQRTLLNPVGGILSLDASRVESGATVQDQIQIANSTLRVQIGGSTITYLNIVKGTVNFTNTKLVVDFPSGFTATAGQVFTLVKFTGGTRTGLLTNAAGTALAEGATVTVNGVALTLSYVGGSSGKDIVLKKVSPTTIAVNSPNGTPEGTAASPGLANFTVSLNAASTQTVTVKYTTTNNTAVSGTDYVAKTGTLTFAAGETSKTVTVTFVGDAVLEPTETFFLDLNTPTNATIATSRGTGTINNDDGPSILVDNAANVTEGNSGTVAQTFNVHLSTAPTATLTVKWATANNTATTADYTAASGTLTFAVGETTKTITVLVKGDVLDEANENYQVNLSAPTNGAIGDGQAFGTIVDDDNPPTISINDITVTEGNTGTTNANFTVKLSAASGKSITLQYLTAAAGSSPATVAVDYVAVAATALTFAPGETTKTVTALVKGDLIDEENEKFTMILQNVANATVLDKEGFCTIADDDAPPTLKVNDVTKAEGNSGTTSFTFTVSLSVASSKTVTVKYQTTSPSTLIATPGTDYTSLPLTTLTFTAGQTSKTATVLVKGDTTVEGSERFILKLSSAVNATIADSEGFGTITNDDVAALFLPDTTDAPDAEDEPSQ